MLLVKEKWDERAKPREFQKGDQVLMRKSGKNLKLSETWLGPHEIVKKNSPLLYKANTGSRVISSVHIQLLKEYVKRDSSLVVKRVMTVDTESDSMDQEFTEVVIKGKVESDTREQDIVDGLEEFGSAMTKMLGLTNVVDFGHRHRG